MGRIEGVQRKIDEYDSVFSDLRYHERELGR